MSHQKSPKISKALADQIVSRCRSMEPMAVRNNAPGAIDENDVHPHHLPPVYKGQTRKSNPIVTPLTDLDHAFIHDNPAEEQKQLYRLYTKSLHVLCNNDADLMAAAIRGVIEEIVRREDDSM